MEGSAARAPVYGMAQAGWRWQRSLYPWLIKFGLKQSEADLSIFFMRANADAHRHKDANMTADVLYVGCYVDDLVILYKHDDVAAHSTASSPPHSSNAGASKTRGPSPTSSTSRSSAKATQSHSSRPRISQSCAESTSPGPPAHIHVSAVPHRWTSGSALLKLPQMAPPPPTPRSHRNTSGSLERSYTARRRPDQMWHTQSACFAALCLGRRPRLWTPRSAYSRTSTSISMKLNS